MTLGAQYFKAGAALGSAQTLADSFQTNLTQDIQPASGSYADIKFWLSMPSAQQIQDYYADTPWDLQGALQVSP